MKFIEHVGIIGAIASIISVVWTSINVGLVRKAKKEIYSRIKVVKYSESTGSYKSAITHLRKVATKSKIPPGVNFDDIIGCINDYYESLSKVKNDIIEDGYSEIEKKMGKLKELISIASHTDRKDSVTIIEIYTKMYYHIMEINSEVEKHKQQFIK